MMSSKHFEKKHIIFRKESYFLVAERKYVQREIGKDPTKWLESNKLDPFRFGKNMTERKMPVNQSICVQSDIVS